MRERRTNSSKKRDKSGKNYAAIHSVLCVDLAYGDFSNPDNWFFWRASKILALGNYGQSYEPLILRTSCLQDYLQAALDDGSALHENSRNSLLFQEQFTSISSP